MKPWLTASLLAVCVSLAAAQSPKPTLPTQQHPANAAPAHPARVHARLAGFDLAPGQASANQIGGASRGVGPKLVLYAPHKGRVLTLRPSFQWKGDATASYTFHLQDLTGSLSWDRAVTGTSLDYPADAPPLVPGQTYLWRVTPDSPLLGPPPPAAILVVLGDPERAQIASGLSAIPGDGFDAQAARARYLFDQRLWYDAVAAYSALIDKYPAHSEPYEMRGWLYEQLPATEPLAELDFSHAKINSK